jgi:hypothetical protein
MNFFKEFRSANDIEASEKKNCTVIGIFLEIEIIKQLRMNTFATQINI